MRTPWGYLVLFQASNVANVMALLFGLVPYFGTLIITDSLGQRYVHFAFVQMYQQQVTRLVGVALDELITCILQYRLHRYNGKNFVSAFSSSSTSGGNNVKVLFQKLTK
uniref:Uncharacterized protein n=1 Tax=Acrobeloides nanus TaxID=290746 RepID=A0A914E7G5_9BILA